MVTELSDVDLMPNTIGDHYVLNGSKNFITHGRRGDIAVVIARTGEKGDSHGMSAFVIEKKTPGFSSGKKEDKLGMRASETAELVFDNCRIHKDNLLGVEGDGFIQSLKILDGGRISIGALSLGISKGAYEASLKYAKERIQFGKPISSFQGISFKLSDMATEIEASELLLHKAAFLKNKGAKVTTLGAMAKLYASEACVKIANDAVQIHGGYGYTKEFPVEKFYRDSKLCTIGEGTTEIQKVVISRNISKYDGFIAIGSIIKGKTPNSATCPLIFAILIGPPNCELSPFPVSILPMYLRLEVLT